MHRHCQMLECGGVWREKGGRISETYLCTHPSAGTKPPASRLLALLIMCLSYALASCDPPHTHDTVTTLAVSEPERPLAAVVGCWSTVWRRFKAGPDAHISAMCLLLGNPLEVMELACEDDTLAGQLRDLLLGDDAARDYWQQLRAREDTPLIDRIKWLKSPSWRYHTEVLGLVAIGVHKITQGAYSSVDEVGCGSQWVCGVCGWVCGVCVVCGSVWGHWGVCGWGRVGVGKV